MKNLKFKATAFVAATAVVMSMNGYTHAYANEYTSYTEVVAGRSIEGTLSANSNYATATTTYTQGNGEICTDILGYAYYKAVPIGANDRRYSNDSGYVNTPRSVSTSISAPSDYAFRSIYSGHYYDIELTGNTDGVGDFELHIGL